MINLPQPLTYVCALAGYSIFTDPDNGYWRLFAHAHATSLDRAIPITTTTTGAQLLDGPWSRAWLTVIDEIMTPAVSTDPRVSRLVQRLDELEKTLLRVKAMSGPAVQKVIEASAVGTSSNGRKPARPTHSDSSTAVKTRTPRTKKEKP